MSMLFLSYVFCSDLTFAFFVKMSTQQSRPLSQKGSPSLPDPSDGTLGHYQGIPLRSGTLEKATYTGGAGSGGCGGVGEGVATPPPADSYSHANTRKDGMVWEKRLGHSPFSGVAGGPPGVAGRPAHSRGFNRGTLLGIMVTHTVGKPKPGLCAIYPTTSVVHCPMRMTMIAINN